MISIRIEGPYTPPPRIGLTPVLSDAEGSTGQTSSSADWSAIAKRIVEGRRQTVAGSEKRPPSSR